MSEPGAPLDQSRTILVEFGELTPEQQMMIDLHSQRALAAEIPPEIADLNVIGFWIREGETRENVYDDIRGWAIGNRLPVRGLIEQ
jgi:hypothetical protein